MFAKITGLFRLQLFEEQQEEGSLARNLTGLLVLVMLGTGLPVIIRFVTARTIDPLVATFGAIFVLSFFFLWLVRHGYYTLPRYALPTIFLAAMVYLTSADQGLHDFGLPGLAVAILLGSLLNGRRGVILFSILTVLSVTAMGIAEMTGVLVSTLSSDTEAGDVVLVALEFVFVGWILVLVFNNLLEKISEAQRATTELHELSQSLERKVADRTRDLTLAMESGHKIFRVRDLDRLFKEAIDLICEQFNLYYGQIYLVDDREQRLVIRAGTGSVGAELMRRAHFLPLSSSSINGLAVIEQRAIIVADTQENPIFRPNSLLSDIRSEMAVPLVLDERVVGVLNLQDNKPETFSSETLPVFQMVADQLALAMQNARLFTEIAQARAEVEAAARRLAREGWGEYLDGITQGERIGAQYDLTAVSPMTDEIPAALPDSGVLQVPVAIADEPVGLIHIEAGDDRFWTEERLALVTAVARQVGQQVENLRLLAETDRYRNEAEQALRRLRREAWGDYLDEQLEVSAGFIYDQQQVKPLADGEQTDVNGRNGEMIHRSLEVQGEPFGELIVDNITDPKTEALVTAVAERLSGHLENLRLSAQTEKALAETAEQSSRLAILNEIGRDLSGVTSTGEIFTILSQHMKSIIPHDHLTLILLKPGDRCDVMAIVEGKAVILLENQPVAGTVVEQIVAQRQLAYLADVREHDYPDTNAMAEKGVRSTVIAPLITARGVLGIVDVESGKVDAFNDQDKNLLQQVASLVASTLESQQLFAEAQKQAAKERLVNLVSQKIQSTVTIESALETTITELGKALQARYTKAELSLVKESIQES